VSRRPEALLRGSLWREVARRVARGVQRGAGEVFLAALGVRRRFRMVRMAASRSRDLHWCLGLRSFFSLGACSCNIQSTTCRTKRMNQGITHSEPSATFNMNHMLLVTLDSNTNRAHIL
jgi:hypothetical protein